MSVNNKSRWLNKFSFGVTNASHLVIVIFFIVALLSLSSIIDVKALKFRLNIDPSIDSILPVDGADRIYFNKINKVFGSGEVVLLALRDEKLFTTANLAAIQRISTSIENLTQVSRVDSLSTVISIRSEEDALLVDTFYDFPPESQSDLNRIEKQILNDPIYAGNLVSRDGRITVIMVHLMDIPEQDIISSKVGKKIAMIANAEWENGTLWITGNTHIKSEMSAMMLHDVVVVVPIAMLVMAVISGLFFRTLRGVIIPVITVGVSVIMTMAIMGYWYDTLNQVTVAVPSLLIVIGFAYTIHLMSNYYDVIRENDSEEIKNPVAIALQKIIVPVVCTGITTAAGFFSLTVSSISAIQQFGIGAGVGSLITVLVSLTFSAAILQVLPVPRHVKKMSKHTWLDNCFYKLALFDIKYSNHILMLGTALVAVCLLILPSISINTDLVNSFKHSSKVRQDFDNVNTHLEGANTFSIVVTSNEVDGLKQPEHLHYIEALQSWLIEQPEVGGTTSMVDYIKTINQGLQGGDDNYAVPDSAMIIDHLVVIAGNKDLDDYVDGDYQTTKVIVRTSAMGSRDILALTQRIKNYLQSHTPVSLSAKVTGNTYLVAKTMDDVVIGQISSIATAFILIFIILALLFRSAKTGLIALLPNVIPVLLYFGILGVSGIELNVTTALIACIVFGIAVDDTIHMMVRFNREAKKAAGNRTQAIVHAMKTVGRPVTYTSFALCLGFSCMLLSEMRTQMEFGLLSAVTLFLAWIVDITFTPAIVSKIKVNS